MTQPQFGSYHSKLVPICLVHDDYDEADGSNALSTIGSGVLDKMVFITADTYEYFAALAVSLLESWVGVFSMNQNVGKLPLLPGFCTIILIDTIRRLLVLISYLRRCILKIERCDFNYGDLLFYHIFETHPFQLLFTIFQIVLHF